MFICIYIDIYIYLCIFTFVCILVKRSNHHLGLTSHHVLFLKPPFINDHLSRVFLDISSFHMVYGCQPILTDINLCFCHPATVVLSPGSAIGVAGGEP